MRNTVAAEAGVMRIDREGRQLELTVRSQEDSPEKRLAAAFGARHAESHACSLKDIFTAYMGAEAGVPRFQGSDTFQRREELFLPLGGTLSRPVTFAVASPFPRLHAAAKHASLAARSRPTTRPARPRIPEQFRGNGD